MQSFHIKTILKMLIIPLNKEFIVILIQGFDKIAILKLWN